MSEHDGEAGRGRPVDRNLKPQMMMKGYRTMTNALSSELLAKLRAAEGEGLSHDPKNNPPKLVQLLQDKAVGSSWCPSGARAGQYLIGDTLCDDFVWTSVKFKDTFIEWTVKPRGYVTTHDALPEDASWDAKARCWFRSNGNSVEEAAENLGLINGKVCTQSFSLSALAVARSLNSAASKLTAETDGPPIRLPFFAGNWRMGSIEKHNTTTGKSFWQPTYQHVGTIGEPGGPSGDGFDRCRRLCQLLTKSAVPAASRTDATNDNNAARDAEEPPESDAPPPTGDDTPRSLADLEDIPF
jgi:hypothetical protein